MLRLCTAGSNKNLKLVYQNQNQGYHSVFVVSLLHLVQCNYLMFSRSNVQLNIPDSIMILLNSLHIECASIQFY